MSYTARIRDGLYVQSDGRFIISIDPIKENINMDNLDAYGNEIGPGNIILYSDPYSNLSVGMVLGRTYACLLYEDIERLEYFHADDSLHWTRSYMAKHLVKGRTIKINESIAEQILGRPIDFEGILTYLKQKKKIEDVN